MSETAPHENPLVPNKKLRQIYTAMAHARLLDEHVVKLQRRQKMRRPLASTFNEEACRVATAIELHQGDLLSDAQRCVTMDLLFGTTLTSLLRGVSNVISGAQTEITRSNDATTPLRQLPWINATEDRLQMALGAALALKAQKQSNIVMAYAYASQLPKRFWDKVLALSSQLNLPIIFVLLPEEGGTGEATDICAKARAAGVPGIPVDATDAVALYRVAQESMGRSRGGDGPVLIECIFSGTGGQRASKNSDPILHLKSFLIGRKVCTDVWANHVSDAFRKRLTAANR